MSHPDYAAIEAGTAFTVGRIVGVGLPILATEEVEEVRTPIEEQGFLVRTGNAVLEDWGGEQFKKYRVVWSGRGQLPPAFNGLWRGAPVTLECINPIGKTGGAFERSIVAGSEFSAGGVDYGRPILQVTLVDIVEAFAEQRAELGWEIVMEERG